MGYLICCIAICCEHFEMREGGALFGKRGRGGEGREGVEDLSASKLYTVDSISEDYKHKDTSGHNMTC